MAAMKLRVRIAVFHEVHVPRASPLLRAGAGMGCQEPLFKKTCNCLAPVRVPVVYGAGSGFGVGRWDEEERVTAVRRAARVGRATVG